MTDKRFKQFESHMEKPLISDGTRCELLIQQYRPFILGGNVHPVVQCPNKATIKVISHAEHEKDMPPMFLCNEHIKLFRKDNKDNIDNYEIVSLRSKP